MPALPAAAAAPPSLLHPQVPRAFALLIACLCSFMVVMDGAIVNVALPSIQRELHLDPAQLQWVVDAYLLMLGGLMLLAARASDLYGRKPVLMSGLLVFTLASLAAGMADGAAMLLAARAVQGCGAAALATSTLAVIVAVYPQAAPGPGRFHCGPPPAPSRPRLAWLPAAFSRRGLAGAGSCSSMSRSAWR